MIYIYIAFCVYFLAGCTKHSNIPVPPAASASIQPIIIKPAIKIDTFAGSIHYYLHYWLNANASTTFDSTFAVTFLVSYISADSIKICFSTSDATWAQYSNFSSVISYDFLKDSSNFYKISWKHHEISFTPLANSMICIFDGSSGSCDYENFCYAIFNGKR
jgi:hypothetical protein